MSARKTRKSPAAYKHEQWLGAVQPEGLVFSIPVLAEKVVLERLPSDVQVAVRSLCPDARLPDLATFWQLARQVLRWPQARVRTGDALAERWRADLPNIGKSLTPDGVLTDAKGAPLLFVQWTADDPDALGEDGWDASPQQRLEIMLLELQRPADGGAAGPSVALHVFPDGIRLVYAPIGGRAGYLTFPIEALVTADGRDVLDAFIAILDRGRLFVCPPEARLHALLVESRTRQAEVTTALAGQIELALRALLAGLDAANARTGGRVLADLKGADGRRHLYEGLVTALLRLLFVLFAEDRDLLPVDKPLYRDHYRLGGLAEQLDHEALTHAQAMDRRFGAWARVLAVFRLIYAGSDALDMPPRHGRLFSPDAFPFLEGRAWQGRDDSGTERWRSEACVVPPVDDQTLHRVLSALVHLEGQHLSYANLSEEELGSMYEALMGFELQWAGSPALTLSGGVTVELEPLREAPDLLEHLKAALGLKKKSDLIKRAPALKDFAVTADAQADYAALREALGPLCQKGTVEIPAGGHYLQPGDERRHSGSHYTPRALTERVVKHTLYPVLWPPDGDGQPPSPERILSLRVCDPAMGSGAFLVQTVRYLGKALSEAWARTGTTPREAGKRSDLYARRLVAERCIYGVDKNPLAVRLAKLSLWLVTLARDLPFTFIDHALREGDALVGVTRRDCCNWYLPPKPANELGSSEASDFMALAGATSLRDQALKVVPKYDDKARLMRQADDNAEPYHAAGDVIVAIYEHHHRKTDRKAALDGFKALDLTGLGTAPPDQMLTRGWRARLLEKPFHWQIEFPEVFARPNGGFDAVVGNPPFGGKNTILAASGDHYIKLLQALRPHAHGNADLAAHFFLRAAEVLREGGHFGLIATNTISQGDTRDTGLQWLAKRGVNLHRAETDLKWQVPGGAAVTVSVVHGRRGAWTGNRWLNDAPAVLLNSALDDDREWPDPHKLLANKDRVFQGVILLDAGGAQVSEDEKRELLKRDPRNGDHIWPYIGGSEVNNNPDGKPDRAAICFGAKSLAEAALYPDLLGVLEERVKPVRDRQKNNSDGRRRKKYWWQPGRWTPALFREIESLETCIVIAATSKHLLVSKQPTTNLFANTLYVFAKNSIEWFAVLQSRVHEAWVRGADVSSSMKTDLRYTPSKCFETFAMPDDLDSIQLSGTALYKSRLDYMQAHQVGMTETWNRLTDPHHSHYHDSDVQHLRELRDAMDEAVLAAYGWSDLDPNDSKAIVRRLRELNVERHEQEKKDGLVK